MQVSSAVMWSCVPSTDLNYLEETAGGPNLTLAMLPKSKKIVLVQVNLLSQLVTY